MLGLPLIWRTHDYSRAFLGLIEAVWLLRRATVITITNTSSFAFCMTVSVWSLTVDFRGFTSNHSRFICYAMERRFLIVCCKWVSWRSEQRIEFCKGSHINNQERQKLAVKNHKMWRNGIRKPKFRFPFGGQRPTYGSSLFHRRNLAHFFGKKVKEIVAMIVVHNLLYVNTTAVKTFNNLELKQNCFRDKGNHGSLSLNEVRICW